MSDAALNDAKQALTDLEAKHSQLGLNRAGMRVCVGVCVLGYACVVCVVLVSQ